VTATVAGVGDRIGDLQDGTVNLGSAWLSAGIATINTSSLTVGTHSITAVWRHRRGRCDLRALSQVISPSAKVTVRLRPRAPGLDQEAQGADHAGAERAGQGLLDRECVRREHLQVDQPEEVGRGLRRR
jgi:hypothetical protein